MVTRDARRIGDIVPDTRTGQLISGADYEAGRKPISERLAEAFGRGENPLARGRLYAVLSSICERHGAKAERMILKMISQSRTKTHPDRWFCSCVLLRLKENGFQP